MRPSINLLSTKNGKGFERFWDVIDRYISEISLTNQSILFPIYWDFGCQMAALNFQTLDVHMQMNLAMFERNGRSGYVRKPLAMRDSAYRVNPFATDFIDGVIPSKLNIKVIHIVQRDTLFLGNLGTTSQFILR
jgi:hypothetical protein